MGKGGGGQPGSGARRLQNMDSEEIRTVRSFNEAINRHDVNGIVSLMAANHTFIDSRGGVTDGVDRMKEGWTDFFRMFPDYRNHMSGFLQEGTKVMAFGHVSGTYNGKRGLVSGNRITMPAAWRAVVQDGRVVEWQVYADWSEGARIMEEDAKAG